MGGIGTTTQQCESEKIKFPWPNALKKYNKYMGYVDLVDYEKKIGGSFKDKSCFKKECKKGYVGILDLCWLMAK